MAERLENWNNKQADDKNLEELAILLSKANDKIKTLEERLEVLEP